MLISIQKTPRIAAKFPNKNHNKKNKSTKHEERDKVDEKQEEEGKHKSKI